MDEGILLIYEKTHSLFVVLFPHRPKFILHMENPSFPLKVTGESSELVLNLFCSHTVQIFYKNYDNIILQPELTPEKLR